MEPISNQNPNIYIIKNTSIGVKIENLEQAKEVHFIVFTSAEINGNDSKIVKSYTQYFSVKKK